MGRITETVTDPTAVKVLTAVENALVTHDSWSFIKEVVITTVTYRVWLNDANSTYPFYLILATNSSSTQTLYFSSAEQFNTGTNQVIGQSQGSSSSSWAAGGARPSQALTTSSVHTMSSIVSTGTHTVSTFVNDDGVLISLSGHATAVWVGLFNPAWSDITEYEYPLASVKFFAGTGGQDVQYSRIPGMTTGTYAVYGSVSAFQFVGGALGTGLTYLGGKSVIGPIRLGSDWASYLPRGYMPDWVMCAERGSSNPGDTVTIGSDIYVMVTGTSGFSYFVKV